MDKQVTLTPEGRRLLWLRLGEAYRGIVQVARRMDREVYEEQAPGASERSVTNKDLLTVLELAALALEGALLFHLEHVDIRSMERDTKLVAVYAQNDGPRLVEQDGALSQQFYLRGKTVRLLGDGTSLSSKEQMFYLWAEWADRTYSDPHRLIELAAATAEELGAMLVLGPDAQEDGGGS